MIIGRSDEERQLAQESSAGKGPPKAAKVASTPGVLAKGKTTVTLRLDRETDDHGDFYVAYLIRPSAPNDFLTFGSRRPQEALKLATTFAASTGLVIGKKVKTDSASEDGDEPAKL